MRRLFMIMVMGIALVTSFSISGCYYDVEEELYGFCDTSNVTYSTTIKGLMNSYGCIGCHSGNSASGNVNLDTYDALVLNMPKLWPAINHTGPKPMPQGGNKMSDCDIRKVKAWMDAGTPNN